MRKLMFIAAATLALAGCKKAAAPDEAMAPAATPSMAAAKPAPAATMAMADLVGTWDFTMADGTKGTTVFNADGSYKDDDAKAGKTIGRFTLKDGKVCMDPAGDKPETCDTPGTPGADGMMPVTAADGSTFMVKKRPA